MPATESVVYTCDVCGTTCTAGSVISYKITCTMPGNGKPSFDGPQTYACTPAHAIQATTALLQTLEQQRVTPA